MQPADGAPLIGRILCALDVERPILSAVSVASLIAEHFGATLEVLYAEQHVNPRSFESNADRVELLMDSHNADQRLQELVRGRGGPRTTTRLVAGAPVASILARINMAHHDLVVIGARQRSALGWQFRGDIARQVAALAACATLTVHERDQPEKIERILVPVDLGPVTERAMAWAGAFGRRFDADVRVLHTVSRERRTRRPGNRSRKAVRASGIPSAVSAQVSELVERLIRSGVRATSQVVIAGSVANGIMECNDSGEFDLVVLGLNGAPQGPARLTRDLAATLRNRMSIPVLSVREASPSPRP